VIERQIDNRVLRDGQDLADLLRPVLPGRLAPEVVDVEKAPREQVTAKRRRFVAAEAGGADVGHEDERELEELGVGEPHHHVVGLARAVGAHLYLGELTQSDHQVGVGVRVIGVPAMAQVFAAHRVVEHAAEDEARVLAEIGPRELGNGPGATPPLGESHGRRREEGEREEDPYGQALAHGCDPIPPTT
jgi:hypothetical protein